MSYCPRSEVFPFTYSVHCFSEPVAPDFVTFTVLTSCTTSNQRKSYLLRGDGHVSSARSAFETTPCTILPELDLVLEDSRNLCWPQNGQARWLSRSRSDTADILMRADLIIDHAIDYPAVAFHTSPCLAETTYARIVSMSAVVNDRKHVDLRWEARGMRPHG